MGRLEWVAYTFLVHNSFSIPSIYDYYEIINRMSSCTSPLRTHREDLCRWLYSTTSSQSLGYFHAQMYFVRSTQTQIAPADNTGQHSLHTIHVMLYHSVYIMVCVYMLHASRVAVLAHVSRLASTASSHKDPRIHVRSVPMHQCSNGRVEHRILRIL